MTDLHRAVWILAAVALITALQFAFFPGQTWLQQDSQIYAAILEHLYDPSALAEDTIAVRHHVSYTIYDEMALTARHLTGLSFHTILTADQAFARACGVLGVFLLALATGLSRRLSLLVAAVYALGASVMGPAVLTVEYEPKPRGSAAGFLLLGLGLLAHGRLTLSAAVASLGFLYHPPTSYPFLAAYGFYAAWSVGAGRRRDGWRLVLPWVLAAALLFVVSRLQPGGVEQQSWLAKLAPELERLQRLRASYNWVSAWAADWMPHYLFLWCGSMLALYRIRERAAPPLRFFLAALPLIGMLSVPASYLLYDVGKWALMAKFQPARALLWVSAFAVILGMIACLHSARNGRRREAIAWGCFAFLLPMEHNVWDLLLPDLSSPLTLRRLCLAVALSALAALAGRLDSRRGRLAWAVWALAAVLPFVAIPHIGKVATEPDWHEAELRELSEWARANTPRDAVFLFPDAGRGRQPGIFRVEALRAVYVDWKSGGQVNMVEDFAEEWWRRYEETMVRPFSPEAMDRYAELGIDYIVLQESNRLPDREPVFANDAYAVYRVP